MENHTIYVIFQVEFLLTIVFLLLSIVYLWGRCSAYLTSSGIRLAGSQPHSVTDSNETLGNYLNFSVP